MGASVRCLAGVARDATAATLPCTLFFLVSYGPLATPPAVFHKFRLAKHMAWIDAVATGRPIADGDRRDGVMVRTRRISRLRCPFREIAVALCAVWETCPGGQ